jgi:outer membrane biogenesis lipoprotein LolB
MTGSSPVSNQRRRDIPRRRFCIDCLYALAAVSLAGCASIDPAGVTATQPASASPAPHFTLRGRISVRVGEKIDLAQIRWARLPDEERLEVFTPFGSQIAELVRMPGGRVTLRRDQEAISAESIGELTSSVLGVPLDMNAIAVWTQGIGLNENVSSEQRFGNGDAWQVTVERLQARGPHRFASRLTASRGDTVVRLVIDEWQAE